MFLVVKIRTIKAMEMLNSMPWSAYLMKEDLKNSQHQLSYEVWKPLLSPGLLPALKFTMRSSTF